MLRIMATICQFILLFTVLVGSNAHLNIGDGCDIQENLKGTCIPVPQCRPFMNAIRSRVSPKNTIAIMRRLQCGFLGYTPMMCCSPQLSFTPTATKTTSTTTESPQSSLLETKPKILPSEEPTKDDLFPPPGECGETLEDKIFGGNITEINEFPWMALIAYRNKSGFLSFECGGVLINRRYILTAAHCLTATLIIDHVRLGEYNLLTNPDCIESGELEVCAPPHQEISVEEFIIHPGFDVSNINRQDDIALLRLSRDADYNGFVGPICLPSSPSARVQNADELYVAGWGKTLNGMKSDIKLKLLLPVFDQDKCRRLFQSARAILTPRQICAGGEFAKDTCNGDSGGPLMKQMSSGDWTTVGIVSFGAGCGRDGWPGVYVNVRSYMNWIRQNVRK